MLKRIFQARAIQQIEAAKASVRSRTTRRFLDALILELRSGAIKPRHAKQAMRLVLA